MKVEVKENHIWLYGETQEERHLLDVLDKHGIKVFGRSSNGIGISHPYELRQLFVNREQQALLSYALGTMEMNLVVKGFLGASTQDFLQLKQTKRMARDIGDLKDQLLIAPEPTLLPSPPRLLRPRYITKAVEKEPEKKKEKT